MQPHIQLNESMTSAKYALLPGDHKRLDSVMPYLENVEQLTFNREFRSLRGWYRGIEVLVISTGIGGPSTAITLHELKNIGIETVIRIGSCGALQPELELGELILASGAVRDEGTSKTYIETQYPAVANPHILHQMINLCHQHQFLHTTGIVRSHDSFYTQQEENICDYWSKQGILAADMETSALFVIAGLLKMQAASILNVVVKYQEKVEDGIASYQDQQANCLQGEKNEIHLALETILSDAQHNK